MKKLIGFLLVSGLAAGNASAAMWNEALQGDLSNNWLTPSVLTLSAGTNLVTGRFGAPDLDYLTVFVPEGHVLGTVLTGLGNIQGLSRSFIGVQAGPAMTVSPDSVSAVGLLGWTHFGGAAGVDLLPLMGRCGSLVPQVSACEGSGALGFSGLLPAGAYTFWINETSSGDLLSFDLEFNVQPVPLPGALLFMLTGMAALGGLVRGQAAWRS